VCVCLSTSSICHVLQAHEHMTALCERENEIEREGGVCVCVCVCVCVLTVASA